MGRLIKTLLVDEIAIVRQGLRALLASAPDVIVVGEAGDGQTAICQARVLQPDVIVLDPVLHDMAGMAVIQAIRSEFPLTRILVLTNFDDDDQVRTAFQAGVRGYLLKDAVLANVIAAIRDVYDGKLALHPSVTDVVIQALQE